MSKRALLGIASLLAAATVAFTALLLHNLDPSAVTPLGPLVHVSTPPAGLYKIADLRSDAFGVNEGMGCTYNQQKTIAVARRRLSAKYPDRLVSFVDVVYCLAPDAAGMVTLGTLVPHPYEPQTFTPPTDCSANPVPPVEFRCQPPMPPGSGADIDKLPVPLSDLTP